MVTSQWKQKKNVLIKSSMFNLIKKKIKDPFLIKIMLKILNIFFV